MIRGKSDSKLISRFLHILEDEWAPYDLSNGRGGSGKVFFLN